MTQLAQLMKQWLIEVLVVGGEFWTIVTSVTDGTILLWAAWDPSVFYKFGLVNFWKEVEFWDGEFWVEIAKSVRMILMTSSVLCMASLILFSQSCSGRPSARRAFIPDNC